MKHVEIRLGSHNKVVYMSTVGPHHDADVKSYNCSSHGSTVPGWHGSTAPIAEVIFLLPRAGR